MFAIPDGLLPVNLGVTFAFPSSLPFPITFRCGEPVGEGERGRPFPCLSFSEHASMHMNIQMNIAVLAFDLPCPFTLHLLGAPIASPSLSRFLAMT